MEMDFSPTIPKVGESYAADRASYEVSMPKESAVITEKKVSGKQKEDEKNGSEEAAKKHLSKSTVDLAFSEMNAKIQPQRTRCEYVYDEPTKRISIKVFDKETEELIREVPAEEALDVLQKVWELAGIIVDEKR